MEKTDAGLLVSSMIEPVEERISDDVEINYLINRLVNLKKELMETHTLNSDIYNNIIAANNRISKEEINNSIAGNYINNYMSILDKHIPERSAFWDNHLDDNNLKLLRAYRHIRNCYSH